MLNFCPQCANLLLVRRSENIGQEFFCQTCQYTYLIKSQFSFVKTLERKQVDDVLGGADAWKNVDSIDGELRIFIQRVAICPKCEHGRAYFMQIQIRSADEPSTIFFRCCNAQCSNQWREG